MGGPGNIQPDIFTKWVLSGHDEGKLGQTGTLRMQCSRNRKSASTSQIPHISAGKPLAVFSCLLFEISLHTPDDVKNYLKSYTNYTCLRLLILGRARQSVPTGC